MKYCVKVQFYEKESTLLEVSERLGSAKDERFRIFFYPLWNKIVKEIREIVDTKYGCEWSEWDFI